MGYRKRENYGGKIDLRNGKIFGGVTAKEISDNLKSQYQIEVDKKKIELKEQIKTLGSFSVTIRLYEGVTGTLKMEVLAQ